MKKFLITLLFIAITLISFSQSTQVSLDTNTILIGEQIKLKIICEKIASPINFPSFYDTIVEGVEIISRSSIDTILESNNNEKETLSLSQEYIITAWDSGAYYIPSFRLNEQIKTNPLLLNVLSVTIDPNADLKDIKQPLDPEYNLSDSLPWIITLLLITLIIYLLRKFLKRKEKKTTLVKAKNLIPAHITAMDELNNIEKQELWQSGMIKKYHSEISETLRKYIENRFNFIALEMTTYEILSKIKDNISTNNSQELRTVLQRADLAKFAKSKPNEDENKESMLLAKQFVDQTKKSEEHNE